MPKTAPSTPQAATADIAVVGLAVMGQNLILNFNDHRFTVAVYNRTTSKIEDFLQHEAKGTHVVGAHSFAELAKLLKRPRRVMLMVKAGPAVDDTIDQLLPHLEPGDIIIDGGNSLFTDTARRTQYVESKGLLYVGTGVSGGEDGARHGPSIMPGGSPAAWPHIKPLFQAIAAKADDGTPCCDWVGEGGAGHYVKMVHNGIEYGDMQLIAEAYHLLRERLGLSAPELAKIFADWNRTELDSYLTQITADILAFKDTDGSPLVDHILDTAGQKGTGKWTVISSAEFGQPVTLIAEAVFARCLSALKAERVAAAKRLPGPPAAPAPADRAAYIENVRQALYASKIISYAQGFMLLHAAAAEYGWQLDYGAIAGLWRGGCIIRSRFLADITTAYKAEPQLANLLLAPFFTDAITAAQASWRAVIADAVTAGLPAPALASALAFYDGYRTASLPANLIQAQRDYFGAHTFERTDRPAGEFSHANWTGHTGRASSTSYTA